MMIINYLVLTSINLVQTILTSFHFLPLESGGYDSELFTNP